MVVVGYRILRPVTDIPRDWDTLRMADVSIRSIR